ncbi:coiled-coil domain-containing protein [Natronolimnohabitans innermongolicus]|uniref:Uncharacterized protein n=1 Tax=Natronolimnohabitans innermongolicus JCM 12255 TaxID=1227499 RepID=L9XHP1_9EURY|nr:hypothetical protein [Natronolimnohabitans innermongolicus]ELY61117.1 hypothetical protein C493_03325 [Natronolimnohabitans innermongolicus JCM 12255]
MRDPQPTLESLTDRLEAVERALETRDDRIDELETKLERRERRLDELETTVAELESRLETQDERCAERARRLEAHADELESHTETLETHTKRLEAHADTLESHTQRLETHTQRLESHATLLETIPTTTRLEAALNKANANKRRIRELQARELEKGAHLRETTVDPAEIDLECDHLERFTADDGRAYYRVPDAADPLERTDTRLAHGDLLPIQQLARMDEELRRSATDALPTRLAAKLWKARADPTVGDDPWTEGCASVRESVTASDLKHWIRRQEQGISETYAKKLVSRTIDAILELSKHRLAVRKHSQRKNGLEYTERRLILPADAEIPGERTGSRSSESEHEREHDRDHEGDPTSANLGKPGRATSSESTSERQSDTDRPETADVLG